MDYTGNTRGKIEIKGIKIDVLDLPALLGRVDYYLSQDCQYRIMYVNIHCLNIAWRDDVYKEILNSADIVYCDGAGVVLGARLLGKFVPGRMTGADWIYDLCELAEKRGYSLFFLGSKPGVSELAQQRLKVKFPNLNIIGTHHGYIHNGEELNVIERINMLKPDILLVGMGTPIQEKWIARNRHRLRVPITWAVGALFDFAAAIVPRAPSWMLNNGLEWLYRLLIEPTRMWNRYVIGNINFFWQILKEKRLQAINRH